MLISKDDIKGLEVVAEGFKIFNNDWTATQNNYCYADENGNVEGTVHKQEGFPKKCSYGLHLCINPLDCLRFYPMVQWNKFARVRGYGNISKDDSDTKVAVEILEIVKVLSWSEFLEEIKEYATGYGISSSYGISYGYGIRNGYGVFKSVYCKECEGISNCILTHKKTGKLFLFNKKITQDRFDKIWDDMHRIANGWFPKFNNAYELRDKNGGAWKCAPAPMIKPKTDAEAYADMPQSLINYIKSLPEFNAKIFEEITGLK